MDFIRGHKLIFATIVIQIIALPLILILVKETQQTQTKAQASTTFYFSPGSNPTSPITKNVGDNLYLDLMLSPGSNLISVIKADISYDSKLMTLSSTNPITVNSAAFPQILEGPVYSNGRVQVVLSVGPNLTNVISTPTKIFTLNFTAKSPIKNTIVGFGINNSVSSIAYPDDAGENVLSTTVPAYIKINSVNQGGKKPR